MLQLIFNFRKLNTQLHTDKPYTNPGCEVNSNKEQDNQSVNQSVGGIGELWDHQVKQVRVYQIKAMSFQDKLYLVNGTCLSLWK